MVMVAGDDSYSPPLTEAQPGAQGGGLDFDPNLNHDNKCPIATLAYELIKYGT